MRRFPILAAALVGGLFPFAGPQALAASSAGALPAVLEAPASPDLLQDVRYVRRCRPTWVERVRPSGRVVRVQRNVCRDVWVGPRRGRGGYR